MNLRMSFQIFKYWILSKSPHSSNQLWLYYNIQKRTLVAAFDIFRRNNISRLVFICKIKDSNILFVKYVKVEKGSFFLKLVFQVSWKKNFFLSSTHVLTKRNLMNPYSNCYKLFLQDTSASFIFLILSDVSH